MTKASRLGAVPRGLEWLAKNAEAQESTQEQPQEQACKEEQSAIIPAASDTHVMPDTRMEATTLEKIQAQLLELQTAQLNQAHMFQAQMQKIAEQERISTHTSAILPKAPTQITSEGWARSTIVIRQEYMEKLKVLGAGSNKTLKDLMDQALGRFLESEDIKAHYMRQLQKLR